MKTLGVIQKVLLMLITLGIAIMFSILCYEIFIIDGGYHIKFDYIIPAAIAVFSPLSFVFHVKTFKFYKTKELKDLKFKKYKAFWGLNNTFVVTIFIMIAFFINEFVKTYNSDYGLSKDIIWVYGLMIFLVALIAIWMLLEIRFLYRIKNKLKIDKAISAIDNIKGVDNSK